MNQKHATKPITPFHRRGHYIGSLKVLSTPSHRLILHILNVYTHDLPDKDNGKAWPSIYTIAKESGLKERQVKTILKSLAIDGYIQKSKRKSKQRRNANEYKLLF